MDSVITPLPLRLVRLRLHTGNDNAPLLSPMLLKAAQGFVQDMQGSFLDRTVRRLASFAIRPTLLNPQAPKGLRP